ncbi:hypothetical protein [Roseospira goensis]|uniref:ASCH domain-containing protein n=1 Tax=Roseospira goensis TaxID=391922 RepID=A0A7W6RZP4_9PROT|nr:hypothetical protein [Roseospira goensis]MBB4286204.1 hypothetical protein [Roseospira goensis]
MTDDLPEIAPSVRQPWAWAIIHGGKDVENRSAAAVRHGMRPGRIAIHAAKGLTRAEYEDARDVMVRIGVACPHPSDLIRGAVIGSVTVTAVVNASDSPWFFGPRGLVLADPKDCDPIPARGALGFFRWFGGGEPLLAAPLMRHWPNGPHPGARAVSPPTAPTPDLFREAPG